MTTNQPFAPRGGFAKIIDDDWIENERELEDMEPELPVTVSKPVSEPVETGAQRINPDSRGTLWIALILVFVLMLSSFVVSFAGIWDISQYTGLPVFLQWVPALFIDAAILAYTIALFVFKARGEGTFRTIFWLMMFAGVSVAANVAHTLDYLSETGIGAGDYRLWIGVAITASAPIAVLAASEEISRLAFIKTEKKKK
jgi:FlaA1/EpsC-like NDP-sugar epimerase